MGRVEDVIGNEVITDDRVLEYMRNADAKSGAYETRSTCSSKERGLTAPQPGSDPADSSLTEDDHVDYSTRLNLREAGVSSIIWCTGFTADFSLIDLPVTGPSGKPIHHNGEAAVPGIYIVGFHGSQSESLLWCSASRRTQAISVSSSSSVTTPFDRVSGRFGSVLFGVELLKSPTSRKWQRSAVKPEAKSYQRSLRSVAERLADVARSLHSDGLEEQAQNIETTVADLDWQCEEFDSDLDSAHRSE